MKTSKIIFITVLTTIATNIIWNSWFLFVGAIVGAAAFIWFWAGRKADQVYLKAEKQHLLDPTWFGGVINLLVACDMTDTSVLKVVFPFLDRIKF